MGMAGQGQVEAGMRRLAVDLGRMRQQHGKLVGPWRGDFRDIVGAKEMGVVDAGEMQLLTAPFQRLGLVEQHPHAHLLQLGHHADRVMVAEHAVTPGPTDLARTERDPGKRIGEGPEGLAPIVARHDADVVAQVRQQLGHALHGLAAHVGMQVAELQDGEAVEGVGRRGETTVLRRTCTRPTLRRARP